MGGNAFLGHSPALLIPRMPLAIYSQVLEEVLSILRKHYAYVSSPIEAPGKEDYGDIDVLVSEPLSEKFDPVKTDMHTVTKNVAEEVAATAFIIPKPCVPMNLAIPWPANAVAKSEEKRYVQVDLKVCDSKKAFEWELFHEAHGDLWNMLGSTVRRYGITVNGRGMFLRIPEIELLDRKKSCIFLTDQPQDILQFLGLDKGKWWQPFGSKEEMFEYAAACRMFWVRQTDKVEEGELEGDVTGKIAGGSHTVQNEGQEGGEAGKKKLKHNDRKRMATRPIYREWIEEFIPKCRDQGRFLEQRVTREVVREEAFEKFGMKDEYHQTLREWQLKTHEDEIWRKHIKETIPIEGVDPQIRAASIRMLKKTIMDGEAFEGKIPGAAAKNEEGFYNVELVRDFVQKNWEKAGEIGMIQQQKKALENMKAKALRKQRGE